MLVVFALLQTKVILNAECLLYGKQMNLIGTHFKDANHFVYYEWWVLVNCAVWNPRKIIIITHAYCDSETKGSQCKIIAQPLRILQYELWANSCSSTVSIVVISGYKAMEMGCFRFSVRSTLSSHTVHSWWQWKGRILGNFACTVYVQFKKTELIL